MAIISHQMTATTLVDLPAIRAAATKLSGVATRTPLLPDDFLGSGTGKVWLKPEMLQRGGAFKFRGAYNFLASLSAEERKRGVIAPSSGNHAQGVAMAARMFGCPATVVMPTSVTNAKREGAERLGARIELAGLTTADRFDRALEMAKSEGLTLVPPYDDDRIIAGQGTIGLEIVEDLPEVETVIVPVGGGGLSAGVAAAVKALRPGCRIVGVEPAGAQKLGRARVAGRPVRLDHTEGLADGLLASEIGSITFAHHQAFLDDVASVEDTALVPAMRHLLERMKIMAEPSGAITVAALMTGVVEARGPTVAVLSGGNTDWPALVKLLEGR